MITVNATIHVHAASADAFLNAVQLLKEQLMATKQDVMDTINAEREEVGAKIGELNARIDDLTQQLANGVPVTAQDLADIQDAVRGIFVAPAAPDPTDPPSENPA